MDTALQSQTTLTDAFLASYGLAGALLAVAILLYIMFFDSNTPSRPSNTEREPSWRREAHHIVEELRRQNAARRREQSRLLEETLAMQRRRLDEWAEANRAMERRLVDVIGGARTDIARGG